MQSGKWQIAEQMVPTYDLKMCLYTELVNMKLYREANEVFHRYHMHGRVQPVKIEQINEQEQEEERLYLNLPLSILDRIVFVSDLNTLQYAVEYVLPVPYHSTTGSNHRKWQFLGVDSEWRAVVTYKKQNVTSGASLLQVIFSQII